MDFTGLTLIVIVRFFRRRQLKERRQSVGGFSQMNVIFGSFSEKLVKAQDSRFDAIHSNARYGFRRLIAESDRASQ